MTVVLFAEPIQRRYEAPRWSCAYFFAAFSAILAVVLPFFLSYPSSWEGGSIWLKHDKYREHPEVKYLFKFVIQLQLMDKSGLPQDTFYSTMNAANTIRNDRLRMAAVKSREVDDDLDGRIERFYLTALIPLESDEAVYGLQVSRSFLRRSRHLEYSVDELKSFMSVISRFSSPQRLLHSIAIDCKTV